MRDHAITRYYGHGPLLRILAAPYVPTARHTTEPRHVLVRTYFCYEATRSTLSTLPAGRHRCCECTLSP
jgi:hypothetical protein